MTRKSQLTRVSTVGMNRRTANLSSVLCNYSQLSPLPHGANRTVLAFLTFALFWITGCSQAVVVELWNTSKTSIFAADFNRGKVAIESGATLLVDPGMRLRIFREQEVKTYDLREIPSKFVVSKKKQLIVYLILDDQDHLYLGTKEGGQEMTRIEPQPSGFPLKPTAGPN